MLQHVRWPFGVVVAVEQVYFLVLSFEGVEELLRVAMVHQRILRPRKENYAFGGVYLLH